MVIYQPWPHNDLRSRARPATVAGEFFVPGECKTIWAPGAPVCTWVPSGRTISGGKPAREIKKHNSADSASPQDV